MSIGLLDHAASNLVPVGGTCRDEFAAVRETFTDNLNSSRDIGASVAVFMDGQCVVDLWGGYYDMTFAREWERHTIVQMFSNTKTLTALSALVLADRGGIDLDAPVCKYWPEFAENGKADIQVRQLLNYSSGVAGWTEHMTLPEIYDTEKSSAMLARQAPGVIQVLNQLTVQPGQRAVDKLGREEEAHYEGKWGRWVPPFIT